MRKIAFIFLFAILAINSLAQTLLLQNDSIIVGEQTILTIKAEVPANSQVLTQEYKDTISDKIFLIKEDEAKIENGVFTKNYLITSFDTGINIIGSRFLQIINGNDTNTLVTNSLQLKVKPYILLDTVPRDTVFAENPGFVLFGKDGFAKEIEQNIPDSIKQSMSADTLQMLRQELKRQLTQQYASQVMQTGFTNQAEIDSIVDASSQRLFIVGKDILETHFVYGSVDSTYVSEGQQVNKGDILFTLYEIEDIQGDLYNTPFTWAEFWYYAKTFLAKYWWLLVILVAIGLAIYYIIYRKRHGVSPIEMIKVKNRRPAHEIALEELERIRNEKIWSRGQVKEYHVQVTDALRTYLSNRYGIDAEQLTTSEILVRIDLFANLNRDDKGKLQQILELADSVKFAKFEPHQGDNDLSLRNAIDFVENTKEVAEANAKEKVAEAEIEADKINKE